MALIVCVPLDTHTATRLSRRLITLENLENTEAPLSETDKKPLVKGQKKASPSPPSTKHQNRKQKPKHTKQSRKNPKYTNTGTLKRRHPASSTSLEDSLGDTEKLKAQLLKDLEEDHDIGSKDRGLNSYFQAKVRKSKKKKFEFKDMDLKVVGHHEEQVSASNKKTDARRNVSSKPSEQQ